MIKALKIISILVMVVGIYFIFKRNWMICSLVFITNSLVTHITIKLMDDKLAEMNNKLLDHTDPTNK